MKFVDICFIIVRDYLTFSTFEKNQHTQILFLKFENIFILIPYSQVDILNFKICKSENLWNENF